MLPPSWLVLLLLVVPAGIVSLGLKISHDISVVLIERVVQIHELIVQLLLPLMRVGHVRVDRVRQLTRLETKVPQLMAKVFKVWAIVVLGLSIVRSRLFHAGSGRFILLLVV